MPNKFGEKIIIKEELYTSKYDAFALEQYNAKKFIKAVDKLVIDDKIHE